MSPGLRVRAAEALGLDGADAVPEPYAELLPPAPEPVRVPPAPDSAVELAEEVGALLASGGDVATFERTLDGLVRHAYRDREALAEALKPVVARRWWDDAGPHYTLVDGYFRDNPRGLEVVLATLAGQVSTATLRKAVEHGPIADPCAHSAPAAAFNARLWEAAHRLRTDPLPFLLAAPTWGSGLLEPDDLVARLDEYRRLGARPGAADFAQALLRVRRDDSAAAGATAEQAAALGTAEGNRLALWLTTDGPSMPRSSRRTSGVRILLDLGELDGMPGEFPPAFRRLGRPVSVFEARTYCAHSWDRTERHHWLAVVPGRTELVTARLLRATLLGRGRGHPRRCLRTAADRRGAGRGGRGRASRCGVRAGRTSPGGPAQRGGRAAGAGRAGAVGRRGARRGSGAADAPRGGEAAAARRVRADRCDDRGVRHRLGDTPRRAARAARGSRDGRRRRVRPRVRGVAGRRRRVCRTDGSARLHGASRTGCGPARFVPARHPGARRLHATLDHGVAA
ncbi:DUF6493 family protein [Streptomyces sp. GLT-R25]